MFPAGCRSRPGRSSSRCCRTAGSPVLGGYYVLDLPDLDAAIDWAGRCPGARAGRVEGRPIQDFGRP
ncbi:MAG TPA: YciI family protein [Streptosporangiaceae bacterium]